MNRPTHGSWLLVAVLVATLTSSVTSFTTPNYRLQHSCFFMSRAPTLNPSETRLSARRCSSSSSSAESNDEAHHLQPSLASWKTMLPRVSARTWLLGTAVASSTALVTVAWPYSASAMHLASVAGGASHLASQTNYWWNSLSETGFYQAFSLVFLSEIGDKTFFIAGLLAMKTSRLISFVGSLGALAAMTIVSVVIGQLFHAVPSGLADGVPLDDIAAVAAFAFFGLKTLKEAFEMEEGESVMDEELAEAQEQVSKSRTVNEVTPWGQIASIFALVFAAEFGDRSFLSTIALSAAQNPVSVAGGAILAHALATGIAVGGGSVLAKYISERVIGFIGGTLFLVFAFTTALGIF